MHCPLRTDGPWAGPEPWLPPCSALLGVAPGSGFHSSLWGLHGHTSSLSLPLAQAALEHRALRSVWPGLLVHTDEKAV